MQNLKIAVIVGTTRPKRFSEKPAQWIFEEMKKVEGVTVETLDLRDYPMPFYDESAPISDLGGIYSSDIGLKWAKKIAEFDAYIVVTAEYNHGYPAVLKNALDYAYAEWARKPIAFVSYGGVAGVRSVEQLRQVVIELQMAPVRNAIHIPEFWTRLDDKGNFKSDGLEKKLTLMTEDLMWWTKTLKAGRETDSQK